MAGQHVAASAGELRDFLAGVRGYRLVRASVTDVLYRAYVVFGVGGFYVAMFVSGVIDPSTRPAIGNLDADLSRGLLVSGAMLLLLAMVRVSTWAGPVMVGRGDAAWLLPTPVDRRELLGPHLVGGLGMGAAAGGAVGIGAMVLLVSLRPIEPLRALWTGIAGGLLLGVAAAAAGWFVEARPALARRVYRHRMLGWAAAAALGWLAIEVPASVWFGPWGWAAAGLIDATATPVPGWPAGLAAAAATATLLALRAERALPTAPDEELTRRAGLYTTVTSSVTYFDARILTDAYNAGVLRFRQIPRFRVPPPPQAWMLPLWIDVATLLRRQEAVIRSFMATGAAVALVAVQPRELIAAVVASVLAYFAAAPLVEQLRRTIDQPARLQPLTMDARRLLLLHLVVPIAVLVAETLIAVGLLWVGGLIATDILMTAVAVAVIVVPIVVLVAAVTATRGRVPLHLMAAGGLGSGMLFAWFALGPILAVAVIGLPAGALAASPESVALGTAVRLAILQIPILIAVLLWRAKRRMNADRR